MSTASAPLWPGRRCIQAENSKLHPDVADTEAEAIMKAIGNGRQLAVCVVGAESGQPLLGGLLREVCLTEYIDPYDEQIHYAVETWSGLQKVTHDFRDRSVAERWCEHRRHNLNIPARRSWLQSMLR